MINILMNSLFVAGIEKVITSLPEDLGIMEEMFNDDEKWSSMHALQYASTRLTLNPIEGSTSFVIHESKHIGGHRCVAKDGKYAVDYSIIHFL